MLDKTKDIAIAAESWLAQFESALAKPGEGLLKTLFHPDSHWRDVLALTWDFRTVSGADAILRELNAHAGRAAPAGFRDRSRPRRAAQGRRARARLRSRRSSNSKPRRAAATESSG